MGDGKRLQEQIEKAGTNVRQLAKNSGVKASTIYSIITNDKRIRYEFALKLAAVLEIDVREICSEVYEIQDPSTVDRFNLASEESLKALNEGRVKEIFLNRICPTITKFDKKDMPVVDDLLRDFYQLPDTERAEMLEHIAVSLKYHADPERVKETRSIN